MENSTNPPPLPASALLLFFCSKKQSRHRGNVTNTSVLLEEVSKETSCMLAFTVNLFKLFSPVLRCSLLSASCVPEEVALERQSDVAALGGS